MEKAKGDILNIRAEHFARAARPFDSYDWYINHSFRSRHPGGLQFAFADGSVHFVNTAINLNLYRALATIQSGEVLDASQFN